MKLNSKLECPQCGFIVLIEMPSDRCVIQYQCKQCETVIMPKIGDCCVFCSYGDTVCPSMQV